MIPNKYDIIEKYETWFHIIKWRYGLDISCDSRPIITCINKIIIKPTCIELNVNWMRYAKRFDDINSYKNDTYIVVENNEENVKLIKGFGKP